MTPNGRTSELRGNIGRALQPPLTRLAPTQASHACRQVEFISFHQPIRDAYTIYSLDVPAVFPWKANSTSLLKHARLIMSASLGSISHRPSVFENVVSSMP